MNPSHATAEILGKEPALTWIWLIYGSVALGGLLLCRRKARWLALALPLSLIVSVPGIGELCNLGASLYLARSRSPVLRPGGPSGCCFRYDGDVPDDPRR